MGKPFENTGKKVSFENIVSLINQKFEYHFAVIDDEIDDDLMETAKKNGIDLKGYKHIIETSSGQHAILRHGKESNDRNPLSVEDFLLIPYIIRYRDKVVISDKLTKQRKLKTIIYRKTIGDEYVYVEEIRDGKNKSLAFHTFYKRAIKKSPK